MFEEGQRHNSPAPDLDPKFQRKLTEIGGLNPFGEPNLKLVWGMTAKKWFRGKLRTKYVNSRVPVQERQTFTRYKGKKVQKYATLDMALDGEKDFPGSLFRLQTDYEWIGEALWIVEQWHPAEQYARTEADHERFRWRPVENDREMGNIARCDMLGPYPSRGFYEMTIKVARWDGENYSDGTPVLHYREMGTDVIDDIERRIHAREKAPVQGNIDQIHRDDLAAMAAKDQAAVDLEAAENREAGRTAYHMAAKDRVFLNNLTVPKG